MIDKNDIRYKYLKRQDKQETSVLLEQEQDIEARGENLKRLWRYRGYWDALAEYRRRRQRVKRYERGKQWDDIIEVNGKRMSEAAYIMEQGKVPLKNNVILQTQNSVVGVFRGNYTYPECIARARDNQQVGEMMTAMTQYVEQINDIKEVDAADFLEGLRSGLAVQYVDFQWNDETLTKEVTIESCPVTHIFLNGGIRDMRGKDITCIGMLMDMPLHKVVQRFAKTEEDARKIREIYRHVDKNSLVGLYHTFINSRTNSLDFLTTDRTDLCRVIQAWELEEGECWLVHDRYEQTLNIYPKKDKAHILNMIRERDKDIADNDLDPEQTKITMELHNDVYWYVRYLSPRGDVLYESRSPFAHRSHPFAVYMSRLVDGEIYSFIDAIIDQQRYINRLITLNDFIMSASAKGVLVFPENAIPAGMTKEDILEQWVSYRGVIFANLKPGVPVPQQISTNATNIGTNEMLALQLQLVRDISGVHGAMLGREAKSGTAASLYAQEASNAQTNLLDTIESFAAFRKRRDYKVAKTTAQCYDYIDYVPVVGKEYSEKAKEWNAELASKFDYYIVITQTNNTELYQAQLNQLLMAALQQRLIDFKTALEAGRFPFGDQVLRLLERKEKEMQQLQAQQQAMMLQGQAAGVNAAGAGASEGQIAQMGADAAMQALQMGNEGDALTAQAGQANQRAMQMIQQALG
ncbi:MAG: hypothetical protein IJ640_00320 [Prevotella sp.]|nr:hypothetical protein [Paludibacteraceae bacterium]MBR1525090.1 hypothetical protein [Prevotella sp.]